MSLLCAFAVGDWRSEAGMGLRPGLRGCGRGRSVESRAGSEAMCGRKVGVFRAGYVFPIVSNLR